MEDFYVGKHSIFSPADRAQITSCIDDYVLAPGASRAQISRSAGIAAKKLTNFEKGLVCMTNEELVNFYAFLKFDSKLKPIETYLTNNISRIERALLIPKFRFGHVYVAIEDNKRVLKKELYK